MTTTPDPTRQAEAERALAEGIAAHRRGDLAAALRLYGKVLAAAPDNVPALTYAGAALLASGQARRAIQSLAKAVARDPDAAEAHAYLANARQLTGQLDAAEESYGTALRLRPDDAQSHNNLGALLLKRGAADRAREHFQQAIRLQPDYAQALNNLAQAHAKLGDRGAAIAAAEQATRLAPGSAEAANTLGSALSEAGRLDDAIEAFRRALGIAPGLIQARTNLALAEVRAGRHADAIATCDAALDQAPYSIPALATKAVALTEAGRDRDQAALVDLDRYLTVQTIDPGPDYPDLAAFNRALCEHILAHPTLAWDPAGHATRKGRHTGDLLADPAGPFERFEEIVHDRVEAYLDALPDDADHPVVRAAPDNWQLNIWAVVLDGPGHQIPHIHETGWLSGVYYPKVPPDMGRDAADPTGWIEFGRPQDIYRPTKLPPIRLIRPEEGLMVLFPSYYYHRTVPTGSESLRISIAFDVMPYRDGA